MINEEIKEKLKEAQLEIYDELKRICVKNGIEFYACSGTAIGAAREHDFIPWDIDIDIMMLRPEYDRFKECCKKDLDDHFEYFDYTVLHNYTRPHAVLAMKGTSLKNRFDKFNKNSMDLGIYIDIMALDNMSNDPEERIRQFNKIRKLKKAKARALHTYYNGSMIRHLVKYIISIPYRFISIDRYNEMMDKEMRRYDDQETDYIMNFGGLYSYDRELMKRSWIGTPFEERFGKRTMPQIEGYDEYLTNEYGDYMTPPPMEERREGYFDEVKFRDD